MQIEQFECRRPNGKQRLSYECNPIVFLAEEAGGTAIVDRDQCILDIRPTELHQLGQKGPTEWPFSLGMSLISRARGFKDQSR